MSSSSETSEATPAEDIKHNLQMVKQRISSVAKNPDKVTLVAVSKTKPEADLLAAYAEGHRDFGENYVQELVGKAPNLPSDIRWHFIGHLQSNKVKSLADIPNLYMIHTVHSTKLATQIDKVFASRTPKLKVMAQVNTSGEANKSGVEPGECVGLVRHIRDTCPHLEFAGLMTIGDSVTSMEVKTVDNPNPDFKVLINCKTQVCSELGVEPDSVGISMGMSSDFEHAIEMGSTTVRVGSTIFGRRQYPDKK